jgi:hypothetical protein
MAKKAATRKTSGRKKNASKHARTGTGQKSGESGRDANGRFLPGVSGNPSGRPPGVKIADTIRRVLAEKPEAVEALVESWIALAATDVQFAKMILERNEGRVPDRLDASIAASTLTPEQHERVMATMRRLTEQDPNG